MHSTQENKVEQLLSIEDLSVEFISGENVQRAVNNISFSIHKGETLALVGESGSGKSVTAHSILRLLPYPLARHPSGKIIYQGKDLLAAAPEHGSGSLRLRSRGWRQTRPSRDDAGRSRRAGC